MNNDLPISLLIGMGGLALILGVFGDLFNISLAFSGSRAKQEQSQKHISPIVLAPALFNAFGLMLICLALRPSLVLVRREAWSPLFSFIC